MNQARRHLMAPDTEPTDAELDEVMCAALDAAMVRRAASDEWMRRQLADAVREAHEQLDVKPSP